LGSLPAAFQGCRRMREWDIYDSFNDLNGTPASGSIYLAARGASKGNELQGFCSERLGINRRDDTAWLCKDNAEAAQIAVTAVVIWTWRARSYINNLDKLVTDNRFR